MELFIKNIHNECIILDNPIILDIVISKGIEYFHARDKNNLIVNIPITLLEDYMYEEYKLEKYLKEILQSKNTNFLDYEKWLCE